MPVEVMLIQQPAIDFHTFIGLSHEAIGFNIANKADASHRKMGDAEKFLSCLAELDEVCPGSNLPHLFFSLLVVANRDVLIDMLQCAAGMAYVRAESKLPDVDVSVISGTLAQWRDAVAAGTNANTLGEVRNAYTKVLMAFERIGLLSAWSGFNRSSDTNGFLLEDKRTK